MDRCNWKHCRGEAAVNWLGRFLCWRHWQAVCRLRDDGKTPEEIARTIPLPRE